jgi:uncharacterized protein with LGFP repeats
MSPQRTLLNTAIGHAAVALLTAAAVLLLVPTAEATPDGDADAAITATWESSGAATGPLGPKDGGVYPIGGGFGQNFAGGKIFFTPATGAHIMGGAILEKYQSLGGPADSDLGFPTIDEGPGRVSPESRNTTFSAADKPVIFWTPDTGAHVVRGAVNAAWDKLGGSAGTLGVPVEDEVYKGDLVSQKFAGGELSWNRQTKAFTTDPPDLAGQLEGLAVPEDATSAINAARRAAGGALGPLGAEQGTQYQIAPDGTAQDFAGGKIYYSPATGANVVTGQVLKKYESVGGPQGDLSFPASSESDGGLRPASRISTFAAPDKPVIFWTPDYGPFIVRGAMNAAWEKLGGATGPLGAPMADQTESGTGITQRFTGGEIAWNGATNKFTTQPANLASSLSGLEVPGYEPPNAPSGSDASGANHNKWFEPNWWWLLAIVPVLVLAILVSVASLRNRHRYDDDLRSQEDSGVEVDAASAYDSVHAATGFRSPAAEDPDMFSPHSGWGFRAENLDAPVEDADEPVREAAESGEDELAGFGYDPDAVDTAPTRIEADREAISRRHSAGQLDEPPADWDLPADTAEDPSVTPTAIHLPLADPYLAPMGYPIKADTKSGLYWAPGSSLYEHVPAEIFFSNEEFARANGFVKAD